MQPLKSYSKQDIDNLCDKIVIEAKKRNYEEASIQMNKATRESISNLHISDSFTYKGVQFRIIIVNTLENGLFFSFKGKPV